MMMEAKFKYALKEMMETTPLEDINVTLLCNKCECHRQTFYYHYQDIYDLLASIFLNEKIDILDKAPTPKDALYAFAKYCSESFKFLKSTYNSAAHELTEQFVFGKIMTKLFNLLTNQFPNNIQLCRTASRRFAMLISDEISYIFKDKDLTAESFVKQINPFIENALTIIYPSLIEMSKKESK